MKKVRWGVLGAAGIARGQVIPGMLLADNCELYAIASQSMEKAKAFQSEFGFEKAYGSYEELLADPNVEAVYIPLPNQLHLEWTCKALQAIFASFSTPGSLSLIATAARAPEAVQIGHQL